HSWLWHFLYRLRTDRLACRLTFCAIGLLAHPEATGRSRCLAKSSLVTQRWGKIVPVWHNFFMCGRYRLSRRKQIIEEHFATFSEEQEWEPRYNVAPTQSVPIIRQNPKEPRRELSLARWGLVPSWAKDTSAAARMINARSETADTKPAFCDALKFRRCLIPADAFYEWQKSGSAKQPY